MALQPYAVPFEIADGPESLVLHEIVAGPAAALTAVAVVVGEAVRTSGWAARATLQLAETWPGPRRVVLADVDLEQPSLHELAAVDSDEGIVDVIDYGVSLARVLRIADSGKFDVLPGGVYVGDPAEVLRNDAGWRRLLSDVAARRGTLLLYLPAELAGMEAVVERAGAVLVLADEQDASRIVDRLPHRYAVLAVLTPVRATWAEEEESASVTGTTAAEEEGASVTETTVQAPVAIEPIVTAAAAEPVVTQAAAEPVVKQAAAEPVVTEAAAEPVVTQGAPEPEPPTLEQLLRERPFAEEWGADEWFAGTAATQEPAADAAAGDATAADAAAADAAPADTATDLTRRSDDEFERNRLGIERAEREALIANLRARQRAARMAPPADAEPPKPTERAAAGTAPVILSAGVSDTAREMRLESRADAVSLETIDPGARRRPRTQRRGYHTPLLWTLAVVLSGSLIAGAWRYLSARLEARTGTNEPAAAPTAAELPPAPVVLMPDTLPYVVAVEAYRDLETAFERVTALAAAEPTVAFHVAPLERQGALYYHVMAGPLADSAAAVALRDTLIAHRHKTTPTPTDVRATPLAFLVGEYANDGAAVKQLEELRRLDIPGYMIASAEDATRFRVYVGGFAAAAEADVVRQLLRAAGIRDSLVTRTGSITP